MANHGIHETIKWDLRVDLAVGLDSCFELGSTLAMMISNESRSRERYECKSRDMTKSREW